MADTLNLVTEYIGSDVMTIAAYEDHFAEGQKGELRIYFESYLTNDQIVNMEQEILSQGVVLTDHIVQDSRILVIRFQKAIAPLLIIALAAAGLGATMFGLQLFNVEPLGIPIWIWIAGGIALLYLFMSTPKGKEVGGTVIKAGKVYVSRRISV